MSRILAVLQIMRVALALTAVADVWTLMLLKLPGQPALKDRIIQLALAGLASFFLYSFGMVLNDLLDSRRDRLFAPWRPIPSGRLSIPGAIVLSLVLMLLGLFSAALLSWFEPSSFPIALMLAMAICLMIVFYNATGKFLGYVGFIAMGLIRGVNCLLGRPSADFFILSLFLFTHIAIASAISYRLESKRPRLRVAGIWQLLAGVGLIDALAAALMLWRGNITQAMLSDTAGPAAVALLYFGWVLRQIFHHQEAPRKRGERIMLVGLFTLFAYDGALLAANRSFRGMALILGLGAISYMTFWAMRWAGKGIMVGRPRYRIRPGGLGI
ncbi:MAG: UbiA family prenyltransferase [Phycisphaerae bacterium]